MTGPGPVAADFVALPKVLLHEHLDGGLRPATLIELAHERRVPLPAEDEAGLKAWFARQAHAGSLDAYLKTFALTVEVMASPDGLARVAREAALDAQADGCVLAEFRCAPHLFEPWGVSAEAAVEAMLAGLAQCALPSGLILCGIRNHPPELSARVAALAVRYRAQGVVGFDLAGGEQGHPPGEHSAAFAIARDAGLPIACHAGEADAAGRILEAARLGAVRIGHGVRLVDALRGEAPRALVDEVIARGLHLEICPTSNVQTGVAATLAEHPIRELWAAGVELSFHTDNRLVSGVSHSSEARALVHEAGFSIEALQSMARLAAQRSFLPPAARKAALQALDAPLRPVCP